MSSSFIGHMPSCPDAPLSASVDTIECPSPPPTRESDCCCATTATPFSRFCGGCTGLRLGHFVVSLYALLHYLHVYPLAAAAVAAYIVVERALSTAAVMQRTDCTSCSASATAAAA